METRSALGRLSAAAAFALLWTIVLATVGPGAEATGPSGCIAQTNNGFVAAGTMTDTAAPGAPTQPAPPAASCTATLPTTATGGGGWAGGDQGGWSVQTNVFVAADGAGQPCGFVADVVPPGAPQTWTASGSGQAVGGYGCLAPGATFTVTVA